MTQPHIPGITGEVAVVTGAAGGIGGAVTDALRQAGAIVDAWDIRPAPDSGGTSSRDTGIRGVDVTDRAAVTAAFAAAEAAHGPVTVVVHAAGVMTEDWDRCLAVNATGARNVLDAAVTAMVPRESGAVVVISSNAGATPRVAMPAYAASKAAATAYARSVGLAVAGAGVRVNIVSPGSTDTPMLRGMWTCEQDRAAVLAGNPDQYRLGIPLGRIATAADIAGTVIFLASAAARHITLHDLRVDGGATLDQ
ncbi:MAG: SDR family oxidoreductase [Gordonia sp. (in: high G+C Gram-positive bacteria)]